MSGPPKPDGWAPKDLVVVIVATALGLALLMVTAGALYDAVQNEAEISDNFTQVLLMAFGSGFGIISGYVGGRAVGQAMERQQQRDDESEMLPPHE